MEMGSHSYFLSHDQSFKLYLRMLPGRSLVSYFGGGAMPVPVSGQGGASAPPILVRG